MVWQNHLCLILWALRPSFVLDHEWAPFQAPVPLPASSQQCSTVTYLKLRLWRVVEGPRLCSDQGLSKGMHGALTTGAVTSSTLLLLPRLSVGLGLTAAALPGAEFLLSSPSAVIIYCSPRVSLFCPFTLFSTNEGFCPVADIQEEERGRSWDEFPFLTHGCTSPAQNYSISALWSHLGSLVRKSVCRLLKWFLPWGILVVAPPAILSLAQCVNSCARSSLVTGTLLHW